MTKNEALQILSRAPAYVRKAGCENVRHYITTYVDASNELRLFPDENAEEVAAQVIEQMDLPISVEEMVAYLIAKS